MPDNKTELSVSTEVLEKMAEIAACEIDGVSGLSKRAVDFKDAARLKSPFKGVRIENLSGAVAVTVNLCVKQGFNARDIASAVQQNIKEKIQNMTAMVVTKVNVNVADIDTGHSDEAEK